MRAAFAHLAIRLSLVAIALAAAGCSGDRLPGFGTSQPAAPAAPAAPPVSMAGRWLLAQQGRGQCHMNFRAATPNAQEGAIAPEGGCPSQFFTSRKWVFDGRHLVISNHNSEELARLNPSGAVRLEGHTTGGQPVTLSR